MNRKPDSSCTGTGQSSIALSKTGIPPTHTIKQYINQGKVQSVGGKAAADAEKKVQETQHMGIQFGPRWNYGVATYSMSELCSAQLIKFK